jgi:3-oxoacyl-[acyl-carrier protein] reductase
MLDLIIVTGASRGIGSNIAKDYSSICKNMVVIASSDKIEKMKIRNTTPIKLDLHNYDDVKYRINGVIANFKDVKSIGIVLCAAQLGKHGGLFQSDLKDWSNQYACNVLGNLAVIQACEPLIRQGAKLRVAFFSGGGAAYGYPEFSGYALSKVAVVRAVENLAMEFANLSYDASIIAVAPGAVATDMLAQVIYHGGTVKTRTDISEPTNFVRKFLTDEFDSKSLNGRFVHVRDNVASVDFSINPDLFKLRRIQ